MKVSEILEARKKTDKNTSDIMSFNDEPEFQPVPEKGNEIL